MDREKRTEFLHVRIKPSLRSQIAEVAGVRGISHADLVEAAILAYLNLPEIENTSMMLEAVKTLHASAGTFLQGIAGAGSAEEPEV